MTQSRTTSRRRAPIRGIAAHDLARTMGRPWRLLGPLLLVAAPGWLALLALRLAEGDATLRAELGAVADLGHQLSTAATGVGAAGFVVLGALLVVGDRRSGLWEFLVGAQIGDRVLRRSRLQVVTVLTVTTVLLVAGQQAVLFAVVSDGEPIAGSGTGEGFAVLLFGGLWWAVLGWFVACRATSWTLPAVVAVSANVLAPALQALPDGPWEWLPPVLLAHRVGGDEVAWTSAAGACVAGCLVLILADRWATPRPGSARPSRSTGRRDLEPT